MKRDAQLSTPNRIIVTDGSGDLSMLASNSLGSNVLFVSPTGNSATAQKGDILKPYSLDSAVSTYAVSGDTVVVLPGTYNLNNSFGLPLKDGVDYYLINPVINITASNNYGSIVINTTINCKIYGKATINNTNIAANQGIIAPGGNCDVLIEGINFTSNNGIVANTAFNFGSSTRKITAKNCRFIATNFSTSTSAGQGTTTGYAQIEFINCYVEGQIFVQKRAIASQPYVFKASYTDFKAVAGNTNGEDASLIFINFYAPTDNGKAILHKCNFFSANENLKTANYGGYGTGGKLIITDCKFVNGADGWMIADWNNTGGSITYNLINNYSKNNGTGADFPITNQITANPGVYIDPNLESYV